MNTRSRMPMQHRDAALLNLCLAAVWAIFLFGLILRVGLWGAAEHGAWSDMRSSARLFVVVLYHMSLIWCVAGGLFVVSWSVWRRVPHA